MISLQSLVVSVRQLGIPPGVKLPIVTDLVKGFVSDAREMPGWLMRKDEAAAQAAFDLAFLGMLEGMGAGKNMVVQKLLSKVCGISWSCISVDEETDSAKHPCRFRGKSPLPDCRRPATNPTPPSSPSHPPRSVKPPHSRYHRRDSRWPTPLRCTLGE